MNPLLCEGPRQCSELLRSFPLTRLLVVLVLRALQGARVVNVDRIPLGEEVDAGVALAVARPLRASSWRHIPTVKPQLATQGAIKARVGLTSFQGDGGV